MAKCEAQPVSLTIAPHLIQRSAFFGVESTLALIKAERARLRQAKPKIAKNSPVTLDQVHTVLTFRFHVEPLLFIVESKCDF